MQTGTVHFLSHLAQFFLEWEMFQTKVVEKIKTHILCAISFFFLFRKSYRLSENVEKYCTAVQATYDNMAHTHLMLYTKVYKHTLTICSTYCFTLQPPLHERVSMLRYVQYIACAAICNRCCTGLCVTIKYSAFLMSNWRSDAVCNFTDLTHYATLVTNAQLKPWRWHTVTVETRNRE
jgi:hypothetical protein